MIKIGKIEFENENDKCIPNITDPRIAELEKFVSEIFKAYESSKSYHDLGESVETLCENYFELGERK